MDRLTGIHAIREALEAGSAFDRILIAKGRQDTRVEEIVQLARAQNIPVRFEDRSQLDRLANSRDHQGVVAIAAARPPATLESLLAVANKSKGPDRADRSAGRRRRSPQPRRHHSHRAGRRRPRHRHPRTPRRGTHRHSGARFSGRVSTPARRQGRKSSPRNGRIKGSRLLAGRPG